MVMFARFLGGFSNKVASVFLLLYMDVSIVLQK